MRRHLYLVAAAVAIMAGSGGIVAARADQPLLLAATTADTIDSTNLVGKTVVDSQGKTLGKIDSVLVDAAGKVKFVVVGVGGFLGIGEKDVALRWDQLEVQSGDRLVANLTKEQLTTMPGYRFADTKRRGTVYSIDQDLASNPYLADQQSTGPAPTANQTASSTSETPPLPGANSFTESQARSRIEENGFVGVSSLKKDDQGIWRGTAMKDGKTVNIALDYKGNVVAQ
jgi:sporulation protein YlmC with PRC-barrel domain